MAKITQLPPLAPAAVDGSELVPVVRGAAMMQIPAAGLVDGRAGHLIRQAQSIAVSATYRFEGTLDSSGSAVIAHHLDDIASPVIAAYQGSPLTAMAAPGAAWDSDAIYLSGGIPGARFLVLVGIVPAAMASNPAVPAITPLAAWTGTAGSGFAAPPADPVRTAAKPACRLLTPPFQWFTDELLVGVYAAASHGGDLLDNMGLEKVRVHYEGQTLDIAAPGYQTFDDASGKPVTYFGWWAKLRHDGRSGFGQVYFEAVPKDPAMQRRVIGPYLFAPQAALHDYTLSVAPSQPVVAGTRYQSVAAALNYLKGVSAKNPLVTVLEAGTYLVTSVGGGWYGGTTAAPALGYVHITAAAPVTFTMAPPAAHADPSPMRFELNCLHLVGSNITLDFAHAGELYTSGSDGRQNWLDGINLTNSNGRYDLYRKQVRSAGAPWLIRGAAYVTECRFTYLWNPAYGLSLSRGCTYTGCWSDAFDHCLCTIGNRVDDWDSTAYAQYLDALTISYTGAETTATIARNGNTFTATWGANTSTFAVASALADWTAGTHYHVHNVADWLNGLDGWSAQVTDDTRAAYALTLPDYIPGTFPAQSVKAAPLTLITTFDIHADWWQKQNGAAIENVVIADNLTTNFVGQCLFWGNMADMVVVNNVWHCKEDWGFGDLADSRSQFGNVQQHCVFAHNTLVNQRVWLRRDGSGGFAPDAYCVWANNIVPSLEWYGGDPDPVLVPANNHVFDGYALPAGTLGTVQGGDAASLFIDPAAGNLTPRGALTANPKPPLIAADLARNTRKAAAPVGALA